MKHLIKQPKVESYGLCNIISLTEEFNNRIEKAHKIVLTLFDYEKVFDVANYVPYFKIDDDDLGGEYDCCDDNDCVNSTLENIKKEYPNKEIETCWYSNDGDKGSIDKCQICFKPLNEWITWVEDEFNFFYEENKDEWNKEFFKNNAFALHTILQSLPGNDYFLSEYIRHQYRLGNQKPLKGKLKQGKDFYIKVSEMVDFIINDFSQS